MIYGVDVSSYQAEHFPVKGYSFAIVKATEGASYTNPRCGAQVAWARANGMHVGHYHFARPGAVKAQAERFVAKAPDQPGDSFWIDWEDGGISSASKDALIRAVKVLRPNAKVGLYCNTSFWTTRDKSSYAGDALWIARYGGTVGKPGIQAGWLIHQYSQDGGLDKNVAQFSTKAQMVAWAAGKNDEEKIMALTAADVKKLATTDGAFTVSARMRAGNPANKEWALESILQFLGDSLLDLKEQNAVLLNRIDALEEKVGELNAAGVVEKVQEQLGLVHVKLEVEDSPSA